VPLRQSPGAVQVLVAPHFVVQVPPQLAPTSDGVQVPPPDWANAGAATDWMTGVAHTATAPTSPAFFITSRRVTPSDDVAGSAGEAGPRMASFLAQRSNPFFTRAPPPLSNVGHRRRKLAENSRRVPVQQA
jgi:hypothetical protein